MASVREAPRRSRCCRDSNHATLLRAVYPRLRITPWRFHYCHRRPHCDHSHRHAGCPVVAIAVTEGHIPGVGEIQDNDAGAMPGDAARFASPMRSAGIALIRRIPWVWKHSGSVSAPTSLATSGSCRDPRSGGGEASGAFPALVRALCARVQACRPWPVSRFPSPQEPGCPRRHCLTALSFEFAREVPKRRRSRSSREPGPESDAGPPASLATIMNG